MARKARKGGAFARWGLRALALAVLVASGTRFETLKAIGADFVYLQLTEAGSAPDPGFAARLSAARAAGLKVGVVQPFDPCLRADEQSARFSRMVPRDGSLLPPALALTRNGDNCQPAVSDAAVESEVMTLRSAGAQRVASNRPPKPVSRMSTSTPVVSATHMAARKVLSKKVNTPSIASSTAMTRSKASSSVAGDTGTPLMRIRSSRRTK